MRTFAKFLLSAAAALALSPLSAPPALAQNDQPLPFVAVTAIVRNAAIDATYTGITDALRDAGYRADETVRLAFESAEADAARARDLVQGFGRDKAQVIVALTEPSARIAAAEKLRTPLVVAGIGARAANDIRANRAARLVTGIIDGERFDAPLGLIREMVPAAVSVAVPVDADREAEPQGRSDSDAGRADALRQLRSFAGRVDLTIEELPVSLANNAIDARIEGYAPEDTVILIDRRVFPQAPVEQIIAVAEDAGLAVFASDEDAVVRGALAAIIPDAYGTGRQIGDLVARILQSPSAARAPLTAAEPSYIVVNQDTAVQVGVEIPAALLNRRTRLIGWADDNAPRPRGKPVAPAAPPAADDEAESEGEGNGG